MGVNILGGKDFSALEAECINGTFKFYLHGKEYSTFIPNIKNQVFKKQCNRFIYKKIFAYLVNEQYRLFLYYNGVGCVLKESTLIMLFNYELPELPDLREVWCKPSMMGANKMEFLTSRLSLYKNEETKDFLLMADNGTLTLSFSAKDNEEFIRDAVGNFGHPGLYYDGDCLGRVHDVDKVDYKLVGDLSLGNSIIV